MQIIFKDRDFRRLLIYFINQNPVSNRIFLYFRPSHQSLKSRDRGQGAPEDLAGRDFRRELEERERKVIDETFCTFSCINPGFGGPWGML